MIDEPTDQPAPAGGEATPEDVMRVGGQPIVLGENGRRTINTNGVVNPRMLLLDVESEVWVPIELATGTWVLSQPLRSKLVLPKGNQLS